MCALLVECAVAGLVVWINFLVGLLLSCLVCGLLLECAVAGLVVWVDFLIGSFLGCGLIVGMLWCVRATCGKFFSITILFLCSLSERS